MSEAQISGEQAEKIATDFVKTRFAGSQLKLAAPELTESAGKPIYAVGGESWTTAAKVSFVVQIDPADGHVFGIHLFPWLQGEYNPANF
jgi:hypothetical protein